MRRLQDDSDTTPEAMPRRVFALVSSVVALDALLFFAIVPLLDQYRDEYGFSEVQIGFLMASYPAAHLILAWPSAVIATRHGVRFATTAGLILLSLSALAVAFAPTGELLFAGRTLQGFGGSLAWTGALAWLYTAAPAGARGKAIGTAFGVAIMGTVLGPLLGAAAAEVGAEWVLGGAAIVIAVAAVISATTPEPVPLPVPPGSNGLKLAAREPLTIAGTVAITAVGVVAGGSGVAVPLRLFDEGLSPNGVALVFAAAGVTSAIASRAFGHVSDKAGPARIVPLGLALAMVPLLALGVASELWWTVAAYLLTWIALQAVWGPASVMLGEGADRAGIALPTVFALSNVAFSIGETIAAPLGGALVETGDAGAIVLFAGSALYCGLVAVIVRRNAAGMLTEPAAATSSH